MRILAIDPGNELSALVILETNHFAIHTALLSPNKNIKDYYHDNCVSCEKVAIEMVACYGMPVGKTIFDTVRYIGQLEQIAIQREVDYQLVYRQEVKLHLCNSARAKDSNIRQALIDRFGEPGTKKNPGVLYGIKADLWQSLAIAVYVMDHGVDQYS